VPLDIPSRVRIRDDVLYQYLQGETVLLDLASGTYYGLDSVGTRVWQGIEQHGQLNKVREAILNEYDVSEQQCDADLVDIVADLINKGLLESVGTDDETT
jgi:hypothetical protein